MWHGWSLGGQLCVRWPWPPSKMAAISRHSFNIGPHGKNVKKSSLNGRSLGCQLWKFCPVTRPVSKMVAISGHSFNIGPYGKNVWKSSLLKPVSQFKANIVWMVLWWLTLNIMSHDLDLHPRWPPSADIVLR